MDDLLERLMARIREGFGAQVPPDVVEILFQLRGNQRDLEAELDAYREMAHKMGGILSELDVDRVVMRLLDTAIDLSGADRGYVVQKAGKDCLEVARARDFRQTDLDHLHEEFSQKLVTEAIAEDRLILVSDVRHWDGLEKHSSVRRQGIVSLMVVPFRSDGAVTGAIYLDTRRVARAFTPQIAQRILLLAEQGAPALMQANLFAELRRANGELRAQFQWLADIEGFVGMSPAIQKALAAISCAAPTDAPVLITGETGTGKELVAQLIHRNSRRREVPLQVINCAAIPADLLEAELFGHTEGAFTGAVRDRTGKLAAADGGTILFDEVSELSPSLQAKLLRFIQFGEIQRLGEDRVVRADLRVLAATNKNLWDEVEAGRFRADLFYRLSVLHIEIPPLRERREDVPLLLEFFLRRNRPHVRGLAGVQPEFVRCLQAYEFPGNVRELENLVQRACILAGEGPLGRDHLPDRVQPACDRSGAPDTADALKRIKEELAARVEKVFLEEALARAGGNVSRAAREAGMKRSRFQYLMRRRGVKVRKKP